MNANTNHVIVVGVDGSEGGRRALLWAVEEARLRDSAVQAVLAWSWDGMEFSPISAMSAEEERRHAAELLDQQIAAVRERLDAPPPVAAELVEGRPADALAAAAHPADLLVLGSHGHSRIRHTVLGSVSADCVRKATCPVVVIPVPADHDVPISALPVDRPRPRPTS
ncbi:universal stress protein [Actinoplanes sp. NPDC023714]|uniref:universal stress protein n=1 Tax=Actinoplanes sp. NPDC023714 TaxID=3154322 RepID=UPI0033CD2984